MRSWESIKDKYKDKYKDMRKKIIIGMIAFFVIAGGLGYYSLHNAKGDKQLSTEEAASQTEAVTGMVAESVTGTDNTENSTALAVAVLDDTEEGTEMAEAHIGITVNKPLVGSPEKLTDPNTIMVPEQETEPDKITLPYTDANSGLTIQSMNSYSGIYLENGEDTEVDGVAVLLVKNSSSADIEYAKIVLIAAGEQYEFEGSAIPAGKTIVLQEMNQKGNNDKIFDRCEVDYAVNSLDMSSDKISCTETEDGALQLTNLSSEAIPCVRVFYKFYMEDENAYLGGITYNSKITDLAAGDTVLITPSHYSTGVSQVVMIKTYDSEE